MRLIVGILLGFLLVALGAAAVLWTGSVSVAASSPPGKLEESLARMAIDRAVARRAPKSPNPVGKSPDALRVGLSHYRENCVGCHGASGVDAAEYGQGLNPPAPDLSLPRVQRRTDGELFWIVSNGIRMTGMPAFSPTHKEEELWKIVAFVRHLPELSADEERALAAEAEGGDHHHDEPETPAGASVGPTPPPQKTSHTHPPGTAPHHH
jgi:mono/diheme cytochrome c family protein